MCITSLHEIKRWTCHDIDYISEVCEKESKSLELLLCAVVTDATRGTSILGEVRSREISGVNQ